MSTNKYRYNWKQNNIEVPMLNEKLRECHRMIRQLDIPIAPLKDIEIYSRKRMQSEGYCYEFDAPYGRGLSDVRSKYVILVAYKCLKEEGDEKPVLMGIILHELLHTCKGRGHNDAFFERSRKIKEAYGYDPIGIVDDPNKFNAGEEPLLTLTCPHCGLSLRYYNKSQRTWQYTVKEILEGKPQECQYCGAQYETEISKSGLEEWDRIKDEVEAYLRGE